jgi:hypothetical protein
MIHAVKISQSVLPRLALVVVAGLGVAGCNYDGGDPRKEIGTNPVLPALQQYLVPPIHIARVSRWGKGTPKGGQGLQIHTLATGFEHLRSLHVLPNGDVLVVEGNGPKRARSSLAWAAPAMDLGRLSLAATPPIANGADQAHDYAPIPGT